MSICSNGMNLCKVCSKPIKHPSCRCLQCYMATWKDKSCHPAWRGGQNKCRDCGTNVSRKRSLRCRPCHDKDKTGKRFATKVYGYNRYMKIISRCRESGWLIPDRNEFLSWLRLTPKICVYCGIPQEIFERLFRTKNQLTLSIDRMDNSLGYSVQNCALSCWPCNVVKNQFLTFEEMKYVGEHFMKPKWQSKLVEGGMRYASV